MALLIIGKLDIGQATVNVREVMIDHVHVGIHPELGKMFLFVSEIVIEDHRSGRFYFFDYRFSFAH